MAKKQIKCHYCGKLLTNDGYYKKEVPYNKRDGSQGVHTYYYCNKDEATREAIEKANKSGMRDSILDSINRICGGINSYALVIKRLTALRLLGDKQEELLYYYLKDKEIELQQIMNRGFVSEYAKIGYLCAVISNHIGDYKLNDDTKTNKHSLEVDHIEEPTKVNRAKRKTVTDMEDLI